MDYYFNQLLLDIPPSASLAVSEKAKKLKSEGVDIITLATGEPDFDTPAMASIAGIKGIASGHTHYNGALGLPTLRERIARKLREENGIDCTANNIIMSPGGKFAIYETIRVLVTPGKGDEVMILNPAWVSYEPIVTASGAVPINVELDFENNYKITADVLKQHVSEKTRAIIVNYPNNPTGCILSQEEAEILADFAIEHDILLIADEIYERIVYDGTKSVSLASIARIADRVITINGFSKSTAMTGWRLGYVCAPLPILRMIALLSQHAVSCLSEFSMEAALVALDCKHDIDTMVESYLHRRNFFVDGLNAIPGVSCHVPQGAFYAWAKVELDGKNSFEIADYLLDEARVAVVPGDSYGLGGACCIRMSFATAEKDLREALSRMDTAIRKINGGK
ncbi:MULTISPECIES: pyridoxal phosphate-dependent aminotransferase [Clostridia]|uniref:pyridoxal phosphate-dependent aminotransferase n=1 Tax=Anaerovoracaceae TaxID=543314 RepID=UPI0013798273|nr:MULTISPECIES: pyridoxal phosphate-dependent aminotransferase [Clostridia]MCI9640073.1 pyridoxal phosphate-dependent aminotransferase [Emergencia sp.]NCE99327.1 pyridoxal phosphate-dependent aminotransferase [Emergencia sp. 1XD21-10]